MPKPNADLSKEENQSDAAGRRAQGEFVRGVSGFRSAIGDADFPAGLKKTIRQGRTFGNSTPDGLRA